MLWFTVWSVLVVGTLVGAFFLGRSLYRSGRELLRELERAAEVFEVATDRVEELTALAEARGALAPVDLSDPEPARARRVAARAATARRRAARTSRHEATYRRWRSFSH
ncbi:hypothetical protein [Actinotalea sp. K2]|uniref:hypothetical protein n=1 Tax=Actinotalea sp. K2 TaxID=2939438 RepID=UPI002018100B|nr:hypothetical protein [Actinotalea sp. K2]MCL3862802.1 hypothetical protein [Actinotalea sp. K2]